MALVLFILAICVIFGVVAALASTRPSFLPELGAKLRHTPGKEVKRFSPKKTLFLIGPTVNHPACKMQRRLLKPAIAALIREDVSVIEVYGEETPRKNGDRMQWLDPSLLRHAMDAEEGFYVIYVDDEGKTVFKSEAPMLTADILEKAFLDIGVRGMGSGDKKSAILRKLRAA